MNANKTKMTIQTHRPREHDRNVTIDGDITEVVEDFAYLGSKIHKDGDKFREIKRRINLANKTDFSLLQIYKSKDVHQVTKTKLSKTIIRTTLYYVCETWTFNKKPEMAIKSFERKIMRQTWGPTKENDRCSICHYIRYNNELYKLRVYDEPCISVVVKLKRLQWAGHTQCMDNKLIPRKILYNTIGGQRHVGKPRRRWTEAVEEDSKKILGTRYWKREAMDRQVWRLYIQEAKA
jgi:hypothetical protein